MTPELTERAAKLLRMICDRSNDHETLAAADRLKSLVIVNDLDWDSTLAGNPATEQMRELYDAGREQGLREGLALGRAERPGNGDWAPAGHSRADEIGDRVTDARTLLVAAARSRDDGLLDGWFATSGFIPDMITQLDRWGTRARMSERQWECLESLRSILERQDYL